MSKERIKEIPTEVNEKKITSTFELGEKMIHPKNMSIISDPGDEQSHVKNVNDSRGNTTVR